MPKGLRVSTSLLPGIARDLHDSHDVDHVSFTSNFQGMTCSHGEVWESGLCGCHVSVFLLVKRVTQFSILINWSGWNSSVTCQSLIRTSVVMTWRLVEPIIKSDQEVVKYLMGRKSRLHCQGKSLDPFNFAWEGDVARFVDL